MISLKFRSEPYALSLPYGVSLTVTPLTTQSMLRAQSQARRRLESTLLEGELEQDPSYYQALIEELALLHILSWEGVGEESGEKPADLTPENIKALMNLYPLGERFLGELTVQQMLLNAAKKGSKLEPGGPSKTQTPTAKDAPPTQRRSS